MTASSYEVVVVGAGPAGLAAATAAASRGRRVLVVDQGPRPGGQIWRHREGERLVPRAARAIAAARAAGAQFLPGTGVIDADGPTRLLLESNGRVCEVATAAVVLATGAVERLMPFPGWTLPGVVGVGGLQALVKGGLRLDGRRVVVSGTGPLLLPVAATAARAGARLAVLEQQRFSHVAAFGVRAVAAAPGLIGELVRYRAAARGAAWHHDAWVLRAEGDGRVERAVLRLGNREATLPCDWLAAAAGLAPRTDLARLLGCALTGGAIAVSATQGTSLPRVWAAGECTGVKGDTAGEVEGTIAGAAAAADEAPARTLARAREAGIAFGRALDAAFAPRLELEARITDDTIVCRCEDVRAGTLRPGWSGRQAKLWSRAGMGICQGNVCGIAGEVRDGWEPGSVRPPLGAPSLGEWASHLVAPTQDR